jgi:predicted PurR-regulated permease PerM
MKVVVDASTRTFVRFWLVPVGLLVAGMVVYSARSALIILGTSLFLALALSVPVNKLARHLPGNSRAISTAIAFLVIILLLGSFVFLAVPPIVEQTAKFIQTVPSLVGAAQHQWQGLNNLITHYHLQDQLDQATTSLQRSAGGWASSLGANIATGIGSVLSFITATILVLVLTFLMLIEGPGWMERLWGLYDDKDRLKRHRTLIQRMHAVVSGYVTGQLTVSGIGGLFAGLMVFVLSFLFNIPSNLAIPTAALTFILSLIPMFGATIGGILIALLLAFNDVGAAIVYLIYFIIYQQIENNYISPTIQSKRLELSALTILTSVTIGLYLFGIAGGIISIPVAGCVKVLVSSQLDRMQAKRTKQIPAAKPVKKEASTEADA